MDQPSSSSQPPVTPRYIKFDNGDLEATVAVAKATSAYTTAKKAHKDRIHKGKDSLEEQDDFEGDVATLKKARDDAKEAQVKALKDLAHRRQLSEQISSEATDPIAFDLSAVHSAHTLLVNAGKVYRDKEIRQMAKILATKDPLELALAVQLMMSINSGDLAQVVRMFQLGIFGPDGVIMCQNITKDQWDKMLHDDALAKEMIQCVLQQIFTTLFGQRDTCVTEAFRQTTKTGNENPQQFARRLCRLMTAMKWAFEIYGANAAGQISAEVAAKAAIKAETASGSLLHIIKREYPQVAATLTPSDVQHYHDLPAEQQPRWVLAYTQAVASCAHTLNTTNAFMIQGDRPATATTPNHAVHPDRAAALAAYVAGYIDTPDGCFLTGSNRTPLASDKQQNQSHDRNANQQQTQCRFFSKGSCERGSACSFAHDGRPGDSRPPPRGESKCFAFERGTCRRGNSCKFRHDSGPNRRQHSRQGGSPYKRPQAQQGNALMHTPGAEPCRRFLQGRCRNDKYPCKFSHDSTPTSGGNKHDGDRNAPAANKQYDEMRAQLAELVNFKAAIDDKANKEEQQRHFNNELQAGVRAYLAGVNIELPPKNE